MATLLPPAKAQFFDALGNPLAGGSVAFFIPGTTTPSNTWQDAGQTTLNTNPVVLDSAGEALIYGNGSYRQIVKDSLGNTIWDQVTAAPGLQTDIQSSGFVWGGTSSGGPNIYNITLPTLGPTLGSYVAGQTFEFFTHQANTGPAVINVGLGTKNITKNGAVALIAGDIGNAQIVRVTLDPNLNAELISAPGSLALTAGIGLQAAASVVSLDPSYLQDYLGGLVLSNDGVTPATKLDISAGVCVSDDATTLMKLAAFVKTTGSWAVGTGNGALDSGSVANATGYHVYAIERPDTGVVDVLFSTSGTAPTMPTNYTKKRRIGWFRTDGAASILAFIQDGDLFQWSASFLDLNALANPGTAAVTRALTVPSGINVQAIVQFIVQSNSTDVVLGKLSDLATADEAPSATNSDISLAENTAGGDSIVAARLQIRTNTTAQIRYRLAASSASVTVSIRTLAWVDTRGRFS